MRRILARWEILAFQSGVRFSASVSATSSGARTLCFGLPEGNGGGGGRVIVGRLGVGEIQSRSRSMMERPEDFKHHRYSIAHGKRSLSFS